MYWKTLRVIAIAVLFALMVACAKPAPTLTPPTATPTPQVSTTLTLAEGVTMDFVRVPAGEFIMGTAQDDTTASMDEKPQHTVTLSEFEIGKYEVTVAQFRAFVQAAQHKTTAETEGNGLCFMEETSTWEAVAGSNWQRPRGPDSTVGTADNDPVGQVSWLDAAAFCEWASQATGRTIKLPTEAQWEKAARGTDGRLHPWGNEPISGKLANYLDKNMPNAKDADLTQDDGFKYVAPVGSFPEGMSPCGALDMTGNVSEWVGDLYALKYYTTAPTTDPAGPVRGTDRVLRGHNYGNIGRDCRVTDRAATEPYASGDGVGFRVVLVPASP
jgi:formylglycine-generating enzyme required for sulfatase activity